MSTSDTERAWVSVRADALRQNLGRIRDAVGPRPGLIPMVKADAYGLGVERAVEALDADEPWAWGVAAVGEGVALRGLGVDRRIVVFSPTPPDAVEVAVRAGLVVTVSDTTTLALLARAVERSGGVARFHTEVDTGMGRAGLDWRRVEAWAPEVRAACGPDLVWAGCYTHPHSADESADSVHVQWGRFQGVLEALDPPPGDFTVHALNSAGALRCPEYAGDAVRPGIFLYGGSAGDDLPAPEPVASLHARVVHVRDAPRGTTVGYGATHVAERDARWATLAIGYGDGLPRALGNRGAALLRGVRAPIVGRISMDVTVVDITGVPGVEPGDVATLIGTDGKERITVDEVARQAGTISYEVLTGLTPRLPRVWTGLRAD